MLPAQARLRRRNEFHAALHGGQRAGRRTMTVHVRPPQPADISPSAEPVTATTLLPARAGFVVGRAVGGAVARNLVRRRLRHLVRQRMHRLPAGTLLVIRALPPSTSMSFAQLGAELDMALGRALDKAQRESQRQVSRGEPAATGGRR
ncbi:MAG: ribonuclease P protein component [Acidothermales bacterium]|nr:ribonuclease P protein component [Acidothermales bacterium]